MWERTHGTMGILSLIGRSAHALVTRSHGQEHSQVPMAHKTLGSLLAGWSNQRYFLATEQGSIRKLQAVKKGSRGQSNFIDKGTTVLCISSAVAHRVSGDCMQAEPGYRTQKPAEPCPPAASAGISLLLLELSEQIQPGIARPRLVQHRIPLVL